MASPTLRVGIAGAGLLGRLVAWALARQGHHVSVFDPAPQALPAHDGHGAAGFTAAGMLSPLAELDTAEPEVAHRGWQGIGHWQAIVAELGARLTRPPHFAQGGSLMVVHGPDLGAARRVLQRLEQVDAAFASAHRPQALTAAGLQQLEPDLHGSGGPLHAWWLPGEAHIDTVATLQALHDDADSVRWHWAQPVQDVAPGQLWLGNPGQTQPLSFDLVCDLRGTGARPPPPGRGGRGAGGAACAAKWCGCTPPACACNARCACCTRATASTSCRGPASACWWVPASSKAKTAHRCRCAARSS